MTRVSKVDFTTWCNRREIPYHLRTEKYFINQYKKYYGFTNVR